MSTTDRARALDRTFAALADPTRRMLIERIGQKPRRAGDLSRGLTISRPAVSKHLRVLRQAGLVSAAPQGRELVYRLAAAASGIDEVRSYVERVSRFWDHALQAFKTFAEQEETE
jgi:DNA-binding transcriptional ArsR family regulator